MKRRTFLKICGSLAASWSFGGLSAASAASDTAGTLPGNLVVVELMGGNDGLNTVIPFTDSAYYDLRPAVAVPQESVLPISDNLGLHPEMESLLPLWEAGNAAVILGLGYPDQDLSHFRSTDIWRGASTASVIDTGWLGRFLEAVYPDIPEVMPRDPGGLEVKGQDTLLMKASMGQAGIAVKDPENMYEMLEGVISLAQTPASETLAGMELSFARSTQSQALRYSSRLYDVSSSISNKVDYPSSQLASDLALIARLIAGGLETGIYSVSLTGFDTHANQNQLHPPLLKTFSQAASAFMADLEAMGISQRVLLMTTSEFGRRVRDNGSGTDHGAAAPHFIMGSALNGGFYGTQPSLTDLDASGNLKFSLDFRQMFAAVLKNWLGLSGEETAEILEGEFDTAPLEGLFS